MLRSAPRVVSGISWSMYRVDPGRSGHRRQCAGPRWRPVGAQRVEGPLSTAGAGVGGWSIRWSTCGMGGEDGSVCARIDCKPRGQIGFSVLPWRWIVERTFAWLGNYRRLARDYEIDPRTSEAWIKIAMIHLMVRRLA